MSPPEHPRLLLDEIRGRLGLNSQGGSANEPLDEAIARAVSSAVGDLLATAVRRRLTGQPAWAWESDLLASLSRSAAESPEQLGAALDRALREATTMPMLPPRSALGAYQYQPVPAGPHCHDEAEARECPTPPSGFRLIGARVRGKKHKHEGTHCDDWFEIACTGRWGLIAVADGAGSRPYSRVGARAACQAGVTALAEGLVGLAPADRADVAAWNEALSRPEGGEGAFAAADLEAIQQVVWGAVRQAARAVQEQAAHLADPEGNGNSEDLACTLLVAAHTTVGFGSETRDFLIACNIGDGMTAALHRNGASIVLAEPDVGDFAGQTRFLTFPEQLSGANLARKTFVSMCRLRALCVMTDGVADDYDPPRDHLARLWADLVVNGVLDLTPPPTDAVPPGEGARVTNLEAVVALPGLDTLCQIVGPEPRVERTVRSAAALAAGLGTTVGGLLLHPELLWSGRLAPAKAPLQGATAADRLREWLDAYQVRSSFDDRTLVILHKEDLV
jgi:hypothetical protein